MNKTKTRTTPAGDAACAATPAPPSGRERSGNGVLVRRRRRGFPILGAAAAVTVLAAAGCGSSHALAPGEAGGMTVQAACAHAGVPLGAGQLRAAYGSPGRRGRGSPAPGR